ncbi:MAG: type II toxin-antitoxin system RelE/ParE family toxin [Enterobacteriaceae bacterium]
MLKIVYSSRFKKDAKRYANNKKVQRIVLDIVALLQTGEPLPPQYKEHQLIGAYIGYLECHSAPDLLLIYQRNTEQVKLYRVGNHSDLFG